MPDQTPAAPTGLPAALDRLTASTSRLHAAIERTADEIQQAGFRPPAEPREASAALQLTLQQAKAKFQVIDRQHKLLQKLVETAALLNSSLELDRVLEKVLDTIVGLTGAERTYLMLRDKTSGELKMRAARNWDGERLASDEVILSRSVVESAIQRGQPVLTTNAQEDDRFQGMQSVMGYKLRSIVCVPLTLRGQTLGVLYADNRVHIGMFTPDLVPILSAFANQTAIAIENARLFEQVKQELDEAQRVVEFLRIQIDKKHVDSQVSEIEDSEFFQKLRAQAQANRERQAGEKQASDKPPDPVS